MKKILFVLIAPLAVLACGQKDNPSGGGGSDEPASGLAKPTNVVMTEATESTLSFSWDAVSGADSYGYKLTASGQKTVTGTVTVTSVKVEGLKEATEYSFQVLAMAGDNTFENFDEYVFSDEKLPGKNYMIIYPVIV